MVEKTTDRRVGLLYLGDVVGISFLDSYRCSDTEGFHDPRDRQIRLSTFRFLHPPVQVDDIWTVRDLYFLSPPLFNQERDSNTWGTRLLPSDCYFSIYYVFGLLKCHGISRWFLYWGSLECLSLSLPLLRWNLSHRRQQKDSSTVNPTSDFLLFFGRYFTVLFLSSSCPFCSGFRFITVLVLTCQRI